MNIDELKKKNEQEVEKRNNLSSWEKLKVKLNFSDREHKLYFKERDLWWCSIGINIGHEEDGKNIISERPVLIIKKYNKYLFLAVPLTSRRKQGNYYYELCFERKICTAILSQLRTLSSKRLSRKIGRIESAIFNQIMEKIVISIKKELR